MEPADGRTFTGANPRSRHPKGPMGQPPRNKGSRAEKIGRTPDGETGHRPYGGDSTNTTQEGTTEMLADFEFKFSQHDETIRRAEAKSRLLSELTPAPAERSPDRPTARLATLLRRLAGTSATA
jgi:hypothetical protein